MEYGLADFLKLLGSLGLFLYGMKLMSEALQKVAGDKMRSILSAMTSNRVYRDAMTNKQAIKEIKRNAGTQFDPDLVERFLEIVK